MNYRVQLTSKDSQLYCFTWNFELIWQEFPLHPINDADADDRDDDADDDYIQLFCAFRSKSDKEMKWNETNDSYNMTDIPDAIQCINTFL